MNADSSKWNVIRERLLQDGAPDLLIRNFQHAYHLWADNVAATISGRDIQPVERLPTLNSLERYRQTGLEALGRSVMIKLNGGLGTSMGLNRAKSLLCVKEGLSFLDIIARQILHLRDRDSILIPLILMNSFSTRDDTLAALSRYPELADQQNDIPLDFLQGRVPKIDIGTGLPILHPAQPELEWCPPGHGDIYISLQTSGILDQLLKAGYEYAFVSNADNLGAVFHPDILGYMAKEAIPFLMEATARTPADRKGGHLALSADGSFILRESAQCPGDEREEFQDITRYRYFNTNNLWIHLPSLQSRLQECNGVLPLPVIMNNKTVDPRDPNSAKVIQLETAMGSALTAISGAKAIDVPRDRFAPVKTTDDLLALRSDCFLINEDEHIVPHPDRRTGAIDIQLDPALYKGIDAFENRFPEGAPSLLECERLRVEGDFTFGGAVQCSGTVELINETGQPIAIPPGTHLQGSYRNPEIADTP